MASLILALLMQARAVIHRLQRYTVVADVVTGFLVASLMIALFQKSLLPIMNPLTNILKGGSIVPIVARN